MKRNILLLCLFVFISSNLFTQNTDSNYSVRRDSGYINVEGGKLFCEIAGEGECIVLLHDGIAHREIWDNQFGVFARNYSVVRYDRRGYGKSDFPQAPFSHIEDLKKLFEQLKINKAIIFGMSGGGELAIDFTLIYPEKVNALVLAGAVVGGYGATSHTNTRGGYVNSIVELLSDPKKFIEYIVRKDPYEIYSENRKAKEKLYKLLKENPNDVNFTREFFKKPTDKPALKYLSEIKCPTLVLSGNMICPIFMRMPALWKF
ncbi:MAG: alpha/beta hydrolase [Bacteroidota bacterium]